MNIKSHQNLISVCSVTQMAKKLGLSRARFYQLQETCVFPPPAYDLYTKRPFYPLSLQEKCIKIRETGIGCNGRPIVFNSKRKRVIAKPNHRLEHKYKGLSDALEQINLKISPAKAGEALMTLYPDNWKQLDISGEVIAKVFRYFQNGV